MKKKIALLMACVMTLCVAIGGTLAWLTATDTPVTNVFTPSDISIDLTETEPEDQTAKMVPGATIEKNPAVTVKAGSEACWLFVKVEKVGGVVEYTPAGSDVKATTTWDDFLTYGIRLDDPETQDVVEDWSVLSTDPTVYYRKIDAETAKSGVKDLYVLANDQVSVKPSVTKEMMNALKADDPKTENVNESTYPELKFTAYATQLMKNNTTEFTPEEAWHNVFDATDSVPYPTPNP